MQLMFFHRLCFFENQRVVLDKLIHCPSVIHSSGSMKILLFTLKELDLYFSMINYTF